jgi:hypothetical protein
LCHPFFSCGRELSYKDEGVSEMNTKAGENPRLSVRNMANQGLNPGGALVIATLSAVAATIGDFLMLYVVNANAVHNSPSHESVLLLLGYFLGAFAIPLYGFGFWAIAKIFAPDASRAGRVVFISGVMMGVIGGIIHGVTGVTIEAQLRAGGAHPEPIAAIILEYGVYLIPLWAAASALSLIGAVGFASGVVSGKTIFSPFIAVCNPVVLTVCVGLAGTVTPAIRVFLVPAAPNVAHVLFFGMLTGLFFRSVPANFNNSLP